VKRLAWFGLGAFAATAMWLYEFRLFARSRMVSATAEVLEKEGYEIRPKPGHPPSPIVEAQLRS